MEAVMARPYVLRVTTIVLGWASVGFVAGLLLVGVAHVQLRAQNSSSQQPAQSTANARMFGSDAGMIFNFIKPDKTAEFEGVVAKLSEALQKSDKPERKQQAVSWKVFRALEPGANGSVLYVFTIDPAVKGVDYTVSTILAEAFPTEVQAIYKEYAEAYATGQNFVNLKLVSALGR
jgi:hypothetical protein